MIGISYLCTGVLITGLMAVVTIWPGLLAYFLFPDLEWADGDSATVVVLNVLIAIKYFIVVVALISLIGITHLFAIPIALLMGVPAIVGGIGLLKNKKWAMKLLVFEAVLYLLVFPLGTVLSIFTFRLNNREDKLKSLT